MSRNRHHHHNHERDYIMKSIQDLQADMAANTSAEASVLILVNGLAAQLRNLTTQGQPVDPQAINDLATQLETNTAGLGSALLTNTSSSPVSTGASMPAPVNGQNINTTPVVNNPDNPPAPSQPGLAAGQPPVTAVGADAAIGSTVGPSGSVGGSGTTLAPNASVLPGPAEPNDHPTPPSPFLPTESTVA
jgi:hypothetical protein